MWLLVNIIGIFLAKSFDVNSNVKIRASDVLKEPVNDLLKDDFLAVSMKGTSGEKLFEKKSECKEHIDEFLGELRHHVTMKILDHKFFWVKVNCKTIENAQKLLAKFNGWEFVKQNKIDVRGMNFQNRVSFFENQADLLKRSDKPMQFFAEDLKGRGKKLDKENVDNFFLKREYKRKEHLVKIKNKRNNDAKKVIEELNLDI